MNHNTLNTFIVKVDVDHCYAYITIIICNHHKKEGDMT